MKILIEVKNEFRKIVEKANFLNEEIKIKMRPLKPEEAIGYPKRDDYPLLKGKEVLVEADYKGAKGQAFTDEPFDYIGSVREILNLGMTNNRERALFISTLNSVLRYLELVEGTIHCKNHEPEECAIMVADYILKNYNVRKICLVGMQPGFADILIKNFGSENVEILDLNPDNFNKNFQGVIIKDSKKTLKETLKNSDLVLATGSSIVNDTIDDIIKYSKKVIFYGTTIAGVSKILNLERICFKSH